MKAQDFKAGMILKSTINGMETKVVAITKQGLIDTMVCECNGKTRPNITTSTMLDMVNTGKLTVVNA